MQTLACPYMYAEYKKTLKQLIFLNIQKKVERKREKIKITRGH